MKLSLVPGLVVGTLISTADVKLSPFWGSENGTIKSNVVEIEVIG
jgi:hypothetical protein